MGVTMEEWSAAMLESMRPGLEKWAAMRRDASTEEKVGLLHDLIEDLELVTAADLAKRWSMSYEGARKFMNGAGAPVPVFQIERTKVWALVEVERYRSTRLLGAR